MCQPKEGCIYNVPCPWCIIVIIQHEYGFLGQTDKQLMLAHIHRSYSQNESSQILNKSCDSGEFLRTYCSAQASGPESHSSGSCKVVHKKTCWAGNLRCWWKVVWFYVWSCYCWWTKRKDISTFLKGSWHNDNGANIIPWEFFGTSTGRFAPRSGLSSHCWMVSSTSYRLIYSLPPLLLGRITSLLPHVSDYMTTCDFICRILLKILEKRHLFRVPKKRFCWTFSTPQVELCKDVSWLKMC